MTLAPATRAASALLVPLVAGTLACGGSDASPAAERKSSEAATASVEVATVPWPADQCGWIPAAAVESIVGPLAGSPRPHEDACLYPLPEDASPEAVARREAARKWRETAEELARRQGTGITLPDRPPDEPAVLLRVEVVATRGERAIEAAEEVLAGWAGAPLGTGGGRTNDWDYAKSPIAIGHPGFLGRTGQLSVTVTSQGIDMPAERMAALAAGARDRIPDRPLADPQDERVDWSRTIGLQERPIPDPCSLLTRAEVEEVLGPLTVEPYRTREGSPWPDPRGTSCAYRTAGHRVLAVIPEWSDGRTRIESSRDVGGLMSCIVADRGSEMTDTLDGPWNDVVSDVATGNLVFLAGDRTLEVSYGASSTDAAGAVRLARIAIDRLAKTGTQE